MKRFKNILLMQDRAPRGRKALDRAVDLASRNGARLTLVAVVEAVPGNGRRLQTSAGKIDLMEIIERDRRAALQRTVDKITERGVQAEARLLFGNPFLAIIQEVQRAQHDLVMLTTEGDGGMREHLFGSTSRHLLRKCPCPVWVVRPRRRRKGIRVLAAVNPTEEHPSGRDLDRQILEMSSSLARMYDGELDIVHVWHGVPRSARVSRQVLTRWNEEIQDAAEERLAATLREHDLDDLAPRIHLPGGPPGLRIAEIASQRRCDVVVMGTQSRTGLAGLLIGNTAETVLQHLDASVLAVKPAEFESPIRI
jgi:nucleotide-binding universal stress UspA family protein